MRATGLDIGPAGLVTHRHPPLLNQQGLFDGLSGGEREQEGKHRAS